MKTIYGEDQYLRVKNDIAEIKVKSGKYKFISKGEWKLKVRDAEKAPEKREKSKKQKEATEPVKKETTKKKQAQNK